MIDTSDTDKKKTWTDALEKATDKETPLYTLADAHTLEGQQEMSINYFGDTEEGEIRGEKITNRWLDVDGSWFEVNNNKRAPWMEIALKEAKKAKGVKEGSKPLYAMVEKYHNYVGLVDDPDTDKKEDDPTSAAWCASFVGWCLGQTKYKGVKTTGSRYYIADDPKWNKKSKKLLKKIDNPVYGAIVVFSDCSSKGISKSTGHVAFVFGKLGGNKMAVLGGNQGNKLKVTSYDCSGNTFVSYTDKKGKKHYKKFRGYFLPKEYVTSTIDNLTGKDSYSSTKEANKTATDQEIKVSTKGESSR